MMSLVLSRNAIKSVGSQLRVLTGVKGNTATYMSGIGVRRGLPVNTIIKFVPQQEAWIVERFGKYNVTLMPGFNILVPVIDEIKYVQSLKEIAIEIPQQAAITRGSYSVNRVNVQVKANDNVTLHLDGVLFFRVVDPYKASYGIEDPQFAITQLAQTTLRSELGKINLDDVFKERDALNLNIVDAINGASEVWGIRCMRYEIRDIQLPAKVRESMQMQVEAERKKRAAVLESEGQRESAINRATGEANAILAKATARAQAIEVVSKALSHKDGGQAASLSVAEQYVQAFSNLAKTTNTVILPANTGDISSMVAQAMAVFKQVSNSPPPSNGPESPTDNPGGRAPLPSSEPFRLSSESMSDFKPSEFLRDITSTIPKGSSPGASDLHFTASTSPTRKRDFDSNQ